MGLFSHKEAVRLPACDLHNHLLPKVDDGFRHKSDSLEAIRRLADQGCREFVFTPHKNPEIYETDEALLRERYAAFVQEIPAEWGIKTSLAAEYMIVKDFEERAADPELLTYPDGSILIEMSYYYPSDNLEQTVFELVMAGRKPILAHPERYIYMADRLDDFNRLADRGCRFQMNWMSLTGTYGEGSMRILRYLLQNDMYSFICTDLHSLHQLDSILAIRLDRKLLSSVNSVLAKY
jgi:protein-tyrosine phosphatase